MSEGDWICSDSQCNNVNFARRTSCNRCGKTMFNSEKTSSSIPQRKKQLGHEIGKAAAEKSRGLFSADDWQCGRCGNVNWARRQQCNMCNAPKYGEVEERTGLGGGYNERENVEYIERDESDGEYDDFGRKKKKYRGNDDSPKKSEPKETIIEVKRSSKVNEEENDEEDDEDEDDGDLSKYDLSGWGDDSDSEKKVDGDKKSSSSSSGSDRRGRSSSYSSQSSRSPSPSSSNSGKRGKRTHSRSRSSSAEVNNVNKRKKTGSPVHGRRSRSRDRSESGSSSSNRR